MTTKMWCGMGIYDPQPMSLEFRNAKNNEHLSVVGIKCKEFPNIEKLKKDDETYEEFLSRLAIITRKLRINPEIHVILGNKFGNRINLTGATVELRVGQYLIPEKNNINTFPVEHVRPPKPTKKMSRRYH